MRSLWIHMTLTTDAVLTSRSGSVGVMPSLEYVPGACLLGAAAAACYQGLSPNDAWLAFHSGRVRFGDALPLGRSGQIAVPMPLALHFPKGEKPEIDAQGGLLRLDPDVVRNAARGTLKKGTQWKQLRAGFLTADLERVRPTHRGTMRTAIGREGRAREGFLYGYDALQAGTELVARIDMDQEAEHLSDTLRDALVGRTIRVGRSKGSEFGQASLKEASPWELATTRPRDDRLLIYASSDLALRDPETGAPTLQPTASALGIPEALELSLERSAIRCRSYTPFNAYRRRPDLERQVIEAGSVLVYEIAGQIDFDEIEKRMARGVGDFRRDGLGRVVVEPELLSGEHPVPSSPTVQEFSRAAGAVAEPPAGELADWLLAERRWQRAESAAFGLAEKWERTLKRWRPELPASQWGRVRQVAARSRSKEQLLRGLFDEERGVTRTGVAKLQERWGAELGGRRRWQEFEQLIRDGSEDDDVIVAAVEQLAGRMVRPRHSETEATS